MRFVDLTHSLSRRTENGIPPVVVRASEAIDLVSLDKLVTLATVVDLTGRKQENEIARMDISKTGVADIRGCILRTGWSDYYILGNKNKAPELTVDAASYLLSGGVRTVAADFPLTNAAADLLLNNNCVLIYCVSNIAALNKNTVRLVALPLKLEDTLSAEARVIAIEE